MVGKILYGSLSSSVPDLFILKLFAVPGHINKVPYIIQVDRIPHPVGIKCKWSC
jgi:hypothetical protein